MLINDTAHFFFIFPVGLEDLGLIEFEQKMARHFPSEHFSVIATVAGGIEISCSLKTGFLMNQIMRTPTRILLRLHEFKCRDFPKLFQKISRMPWNLWMIGQSPEVESAAKNSRLFDSRKIEKAVADGVLEFYRRQPVRKKFLEHMEATENSRLPRIYVRLEDDLCTVSLDTTGERLHLRGEKLLTGHAPIRENLAALLLIELKKFIKHPPVTLIDPMCGSGTFLLEAKNSEALTFERDFAFMHTPLYLEAKSSIEKPAAEENHFYASFLGMDIDAGIVDQAMSNTRGIKIIEEDLFSDNVYEEKHPVVIVNPPYGIRIGENITLDFFHNVILAIKKKFHPEVLGIIIPKDFKLMKNDQWTIHSARAFKNGGIDVVFYVLGFK